MLRIYIIIALVICSYSNLLFTCRADDEFAEFDDFVPGETTKQDDLEVVGETYQPISNDAKIEEKVTVKEFVEDKVKFPPIEETGEKAQKKPDLKLVNAPLPRIYNWESYYIEISFLLAALLYFVNFFVGSGKNKKLAHQWYDQSKDILKQQFALVGGSQQISEGTQKREDEGDPIPAKKQRGLIKSTESMYTLWNSGRVGTFGLLVEINLLKRQDLFNMALNLLKPKTDNLILRFVLCQEYQNFVFCLAHKTYAPKLARDMIDINTFCPKRKPISKYGIASERLFVMSELRDATDFILDQSASFIKKYEQRIKFIHITDHFSIVRSEDVLPAKRFAKSTSMATFSFDLPRDAKESTEFVLFALNLLDRLRRFRLARESKQKSEKNRQKIIDIIQKTEFSQRQEAAQSKKEELRRLEKERVYSEDDPEKQRRWEKKEAKREVKKNKMRVKQLKVKSM